MRSPPAMAAGWCRSRKFRATMCSAATRPASRASMNALTSGPTDEDRPMLEQNITRRRMIAIAASAAGSALLFGGRTAGANQPVRWRGSALGAQVSIEIHHPDSAAAERLVERCVLDVWRQEQQFSLYRTDSAICSLNRTGILVA